MLVDAHSRDFELQGWHPVDTCGSASEFQRRCLVNSHDGALQIMYW